MSTPTVGGGNTYEIVLAPQSPTSIVLAASSPTEVSLAASGPPGPPGPPGPAGGETFVYDRGGVPAATWTIAHNLGRFPHVSVLADDGTEVTSDVVHADLNTTVVTFAEPFSGKAIIG